MRETAFGYFDPAEPVGHLTGNLPHWRQEGVTYFVTFRLADSLPRERLDRWLAEREEWHKANPEPHTAQQRLEYYQRFPERLQHWLDQGYGACVLEIPEVKLLVESALRHFDSERYFLDEFEVMPNHVHVLVTPLAQHALSPILHSWKSFSAHEIAKVEAASRRLGAGEHCPPGSPASSRRIWQKESFDHIVRGPDSLEKFRQYIRENRKVAEALRQMNEAAPRRLD